MMHHRDSSEFVEREIRKTAWVGLLTRPINIGWVNLGQGCPGAATSRLSTGLMNNRFRSWSLNA
ncbi:protein of unknown function [Methylocaldum szegediense]|uniref:Uncharacterized protein n=1 Tax=Methylocaldum szegediense TaxID=73780 RepID=A0ABN8X5X8_9GAMM|nr:protein of unknown function [Methylocaldum szegediense]